MTDPADVRISRMYRGDCAWALVALVTLWVTIAFVFYKVWSVSSDPQVIMALAGGAITLIVLNTASIVALIRHYTTDKFHLYGLDLFYLDTMRLTGRGKTDERE